MCSFTGKRRQYGVILSIHEVHNLTKGNCHSSRIKHYYERYHRNGRIQGSSLRQMAYRGYADTVGNDVGSSKTSSTTTQKYVVEISYDGTAFCGFQLQPKVPTIQGKLEVALQKYLGVSREELVLQGAARTDSGVHAKQQYIEFFSPRRLDCNKFVHAMNNMLPEDICVHSLRNVNSDFNVRYCQGKIYTYDISLTRNPFLSRYTHLANRVLDIDGMRRASKKFVGARNFRLLTNTTRDVDQRGTDYIRLMYQCDVQFLDYHAGDIVRIAVMGKGFLYKQVRNMAGVLISVGQGALSTEDVEILVSGDTQRVTLQKSLYKVAEAKGLTLQRVYLQDEQIPKDNIFDVLSG
jgi:tRNA pseudouridine38-40 synthase